MRISRLFKTSGRPGSNRRPSAWECAEDGVTSSNERARNRRVVAEMVAKRAPKKWRLLTPAVVALFAVCSQITIAAPSKPGAAPKHTRWTIQNPPPHPTLRDLVNMRIRIDNWVSLGRCEQPGSGWRGVDWKQTGNYIGGLGFYSGTYGAYKPKSYPWPPHATPAHLIIVAERVKADVGITAWGCSGAWR